MSMKHSINYNNDLELNEYTSLLKPKARKRRGCSKPCILKYGLLALGITSIITSITWLAVDETTNFQCKLSYTYPDSYNNLTLTYSTFFDYKLNYVEIENTKSTNDPLILKPTTTSFYTYNLIPRYIHRVNFTNLKYDSLYRYRLNIGLFETRNYQFKIPQKNKREWNVLMYGDMGLVGHTALKYIKKRIFNTNIDFFLHLGDIAYNLEEFFGVVGDWYLTILEPISSIIPYMTVAGNHEQYNNFTNYYNRFTMPERNIYNNLWYSLDMPPIKFINMNSESFYYSFQTPTINNLINYLNNTLMELNRSIFPWVIVSAHRPMYCSSDNKDDCTHWKSDKLRISLENMFHKNNVTIYMSAHEHSYERICPVFNGICQKESKRNKTFFYNNLKNTIHIVNGGSGNREGNSGFISVPESWSILRNMDKSYGVLFANYSYLNWTAYGIENNREVVIDSIDIIKN